VARQTSWCGGAHTAELVDTTENIDAWDELRSWTPVVQWENLSEV
tara:strand:+ start:155 stop:289 length:135 start_codon:yes stop_codon:yes gene_type:complete